MKLPNNEEAYVPISKLIDYLLSETHISGKSKSKFFRMFGFNETNLEMLEQGLLAIAKTQDVVEITTSPHGTKYKIDGSLFTPINRFVRVKTVWIVEKDQDIPRFVTAHPN